MRGIGFTFKILRPLTLLIDIGTTHLIIYFLSAPLKFKISRKNKVFKFKSFNAKELKEMLFCLHQLKIPNNYTGKGIRYKNDITSLKKGKRKNKKQIKKPHQKLNKKLYLIKLSTTIQFYSKTNANFK